MQAPRRIDGRRPIAHGNHPSSRGGQLRERHPYTQRRASVQRELQPDRRIIAANTIYILDLAVPPGLDRVGRVWDRNARGSLQINLQPTLDCDGDGGNIVPHSGSALGAPSSL